MMHFLTTLALATGTLALVYPEDQIPIGGPKEPSRYSVQTPPLDTEWTYQVGTDPWPQYPRPKLQRSQWQSLNGIWTYEDASGSASAAIDSPPFNRSLSQEVLVPFCLESGLSGIQGVNTTHSWYRTSFKVPSKWTGDRVLLNFGAVDYEATIWVNGHKLGFNRGGYFAFSLDVTDYLKEGQNELIVFAWDPTDADPHVVPIGKQSLAPSHIFYRPCSGIWQTVWIEAVPRDYITDLSMNGDANGLVTMVVSTSAGKSSDVEITVYEKGTNNSLATHDGITNAPIAFKLKSPKTWSPDSPNLYDVTIKTSHDTIKSYIGFRTITRETINGVQRVVLNGEPIFPFGTLDQGYWPDGLHTPPTYEAMAFDIKALKKLGYNMLRKHVKIESALYYAAADELGILIMQDMPCLGVLQVDVGAKKGVSIKRLPTREEQGEFRRQLELMVTQFRSYESIFSWVIYNEGWGQITDHNPEFPLADIIKAMDPYRLVNAASGWHDHGAGDFSDNHHYAEPQCGTPWSDNTQWDESRTAFQGEFGGLGHNVSEANLWKVKQAIDTIDETYELFDTLETWNTRGRYLLAELLSQVELYACAGGVWTQTTDVEGEVNGMLTYDRRIMRPNVKQWKADVQALYDASARRSK